ncbi:MAG: CHAT domain-containing protein [Myxococcales bacterium]|nr:CHAT domain-containing protein [Myxococcales bacterium]
MAVDFPTLTSIAPYGARGRAAADVLPTDLVAEELGDGLQRWSTVARASQSRAGIAGAVFRIPSPNELGLPGKAGEWTAKTLLRYVGALEDRLMPRPGVCDVSATGEVADAPLKEGAFPRDGRVLLLLHGTFSNPVGAFADLLASPAFPSLHARYDRVLALRHHTVATSPMLNVAQLLQVADGSGAVLDLVSHSRGGLVGDLICAAGQLSKAKVQSAYGSDHHLVAKDFEPLYGAHLPAVRRFVRVACPAGGTPLIGEGTRLHGFLSLVTWLIEKGAQALEGTTGIPVLQEMVAFARAVLLTTVASTEDPRALPGLASMDVDGGLVRLLSSLVDRETSLFDVQGQYGGRLDPTRWFVDLLHGTGRQLFARNDVIVPTASMLRGVRRQHHRVHLEDRIWHLRYFSRPAVAGEILGHLTGAAVRSRGAAAEGSAGKLLLIPASHGWRDGCIDPAYVPLVQELTDAGWEVEPLLWDAGAPLGEIGRPDAIVAHLDGAAVAEHVLRAHPDVPVVVLGRVVPRPDPATTERRIAGSCEEESVVVGLFHGDRRWALPGSPATCVSQPGVGAAVATLLRGRPPALRTGEPRTFVLGSQAAGPQADRYLLAWSAAEAADRSEDAVRLEVHWGGMRELPGKGYAVVAFRYAGDPLDGPLLDLRSHGLDEVAAAGLLPDALGATWSRGPVFVGGLGTASTLTGALLEGAVRKVVTHALFEGHATIGLHVPGLSGADELGPRAAAEAVIRGALEAERRRAELDVGSPLRRLLLVERREGLAGEVLRTAIRLAEPGELGRDVVVRPDLVKANGYYGDAPDSSDLGTYENVRVVWKNPKEQDDDERRFEIRVEGRSEVLNRRRAFRDAAPSASPGDVRTATQLLVPTMARSILDGPLQLELPDPLRHYPWERLDLTGDPVALRFGLLRAWTVPEPHEECRTPHRVDRRPPNPGRQALVIGNPEGAMLPQAEVEARQVAAVLERFGYDVTLLVGADGETNLRTLVSRPWRVIHIAAHGDEHGIIDIGPGERGLSEADVRHLEGDGVPALLFLSCCWSDRLDVESFATAAQQRGVRTLVATGWPVDDRAARAFTERLYHELLGGERLGPATVTARRAARRVGDHLATWAAYRVYGEPGFRVDLGGGRLVFEVERLVTQQDVLGALTTVTGQLRSGDRDPAETLVPALVQTDLWKRWPEARYRMALLWVDLTYAQDPVAAVRKALDLLGDPRSEPYAGLNHLTAQAKLAWNLSRLTDVDDAEARSRITALAAVASDIRTTILHALATGDFGRVPVDLARVERWAFAGSGDPPDLSSESASVWRYARASIAAVRGEPLEPDVLGLAQMDAEHLAWLVAR